MAGILSLSPEDEKRLHPEVVKWFYDRRAEIQFEVPLEELRDDDLNAFLSDDEKREFTNYKDEITKGLVSCIDMNTSSADPMTNAAISLSLIKFQVNSLLPMRRIGLLLKYVHQRKVTKAKQERIEREEEDKRSREQAEAEQRKKEEEERWLIAFRVVNPPLKDAKKYLDDKEHDKFKQAILEATKVYLIKGEAYLDDLRTYGYRRFLREIDYRKEEERQKIAANIAAQEFNQRLNKEKARLKASLYPNRIDHESYFKKKIKDRRYTGHSFTQFLSSKERQGFDKAILDISRKKIAEIVSGDFRQFIDSKCWRSYFLLPSAEYHSEGVPCLDFKFSIFAIVKTEVWLKPGQKSFNGYIFKFPWREEKSCLLRRWVKFGSQLTEYVKSMKK